MEYEDGARFRRENEDGAVYAVNEEYTATPGPNGIVVRKLSDGTSPPSVVGFGSRKSHHHPVLAFHPARLSVLAASNGSQFAIFDVTASTTRHMFKGNGRNITSLSFSQSDSLLATGTADGTVCVWSLGESSRPLHILRGLRNACMHVAMHAHHADVVAGTHGNQISVWKIPNAKPIASITTKPATLRGFTWHPMEESQILTASHGGIVSLYDLKRAVPESRSATRATTTDSSDDEDDPPSQTGGTRQATSCTAFSLGYAVTQAESFGENGMVVLPGTRKDLYFYSYSLDYASMTELWRLHKEAAIECFALRRNSNAMEVMIISDSTTEVYKIPGAVLDGMGWSSGADASHLRADDRDSLKSTAPPRLGLMRPLRRTGRKSTPPESSVPKARPRGTKGSPLRSKSRRAKRDATSRPGTPVSQSMTSSLELPKERNNDDEEDSPMPFLSPNIPARKASPGLITPLDESMQLPPLALFDSTATATDHAHESDSDDETFAGDMKSSGTFLPGGINVPLPKTCGALFGPNGQLITFFPYSNIKPLSDNQTLSKGSNTADKHDEEVNRLFPTFGNFLTASSLHGQSSDSGNSTPENVSNGAPKFAIQSSSFDEGPSWALKTSPIKTHITPLPGDHRVKVSIRNIESVTPTRHLLANTYALFTDDGQTNSAMCRGNAVHAAKEGLHVAASAWRILAVVLESRVADSLELDGFGKIAATLLGQRPAMSRNTSMASTREGFSVDEDVSMHPLMDIPFGRSWAVEKLFTWIESHGDVQLIACMSTLLERTCERLVANAKTIRRLQRGNVHSNLQTSVKSGLDSTMSPPSVPTLQTELAITATTDSSPNKTYRSRLSSGNPSQPTTPHLESSNSTPPFTFSTMVRQNSKLSTSGSASPEHHRSSFGAAAKNYAASIAEKFGSYGSSPPLKKFGTSPGNELSSSLPTATGSWSKSVSFASTMEPSKNSQRSLSLAQEDDNYDSDRTVEDNSVLNTPKKPSTGVSVTMARSAFFDEKSGRGPGISISKRLAAKGSFWRESYAEHLRSWDLLIEAAEMENVTAPNSSNASENGPGRKDVAPETASGRRYNDCSICACIVQTAEQMCPHCLHSTHPACLDDLVIALGPENFTCPTGCGCDCTLVVETDLIHDDVVTEEEDAEPEQLFKKRPSLTDPLRLRQRLQGESW